MFDQVRQKSFHLGLLPILATLRLLPKRYRWRALIALEALLRPIARALLPDAGFYPDLIAEGDRRLYRTIERATRAGVQFDPVIEHVGIEVLEAALDQDAGCLCVGIHAELLYLAERYLYDRANNPAIISLNLGINVLGTSVMSDFILRNSHVLLHVRRAIRDGKPVLALIDYDDGQNVVQVQLGERSLGLKTPLITLARKLGTPIVFFHAVRSGDVVRLIWGAPSRAESEGAEVVAELGDFLRSNLQLPQAA